MNTCTEYLHHSYTPVIAVQDPRALTTRVVQFHRRDVADMAQLRVTQQIFDVAARPVGNRDPRLFALAQSDASIPANMAQVFSLSGAVLLGESVDAGWRLGLSGEAGQTLETWDGREEYSLGGVEQVLVSGINYNAFGQVESEIAGNGVSTANSYDPANGSLQQLTAHKRDGTTLQDLRYEYDPAGNILRIEDASQTTRYFRNQIIEAVSTYRCCIGLRVRRRELATISCATA